MFFTDKHEWIKLQQNIGIVGISDYAQNKLGDIVYVQLPRVGDELLQHGEFGAVESVKAASELYSPASGKVIEVNDLVESNAALINKSAQEEVLSRSSLKRDGNQNNCPGIFF
ncbi:unnamed protein product [Protopolystoma xenopodis]|uniref:Glycine cleavage system H protein, mitochondrial n=1 Tax=Protopolystoma xenopodis TaxID=117903 RepID=A0A448XLT4_9PLAT|nr:unnamed protein product [Protopolystoma xenopodis]